MPEPSYNTQLSVLLDGIGAFERAQGLPENSLKSLVLSGIEVVEDHDPVSYADLMSMDLPAAEPTIGWVNGVDKPLFYREGINLVYGPAGDGKTMMMQRIVLDEIARGHKVLWIDAEEAVWNGVKTRWSALSESDQDGLWLTLIDSFPARRRDKLVEFVIENKIDMVVVDSFGEFMGKTGRKEVDDIDVQTAYDFLMPFAAAGAALVIIDHPPKSDRRTASGSKRKMARPWVTYATNIDTDDTSDRAFSKEQSGYMRLYCMKDRYGSRPNGSVAARMDVVPQLGRTQVTIRKDYDDVEEMLVDETRDELRNRQSDDVLISELVKLAEDMPLTAKFAVTAMRFETKKRAQEVIDLAVARSRLMYSKQHGGYIPTPGSRSHVTIQ